MRAGIGVDPRALALLVAVSSQNSFIMTVLFICIATLFIYLFI